MAEYKLKLKNRELTGKKLTALRNEGMIPSVVYGGKAPILTASFYVETEKVLKRAECAAAVRAAAVVQTAKNAAVTKLTKTNVK